MQHLCKFRKEVSEIYMRRIREGSLNVGLVDLSPEVQAQFVGSENGLQLCRMVANSIGSVRGKT